MLDRQLYWIDTSSIDINKTSNIRKYLENHKDELQERYAVRKGGKKWYEFAVVNMPDVFLSNEKIVVPYKCPENRFMIDTSGALSSQDVYALRLHSGSTYSHFYLVAVLNSSAMTYWYQKFYGRRKKAEFDYYSNLIEKIPIRRIDITTATDEREQRVGEIIGAYSISDNAGVLTRVQDVLAVNQTDVVHDLLTHLAQRMIDLNKEKQGEVKRFLGWLEDRLKIKPDKQGRTSADSLSGTTKRAFVDYLGDHQRGQMHLPFRKNQSEDDFIWFLHKNRNRFAVSAKEIEGEIEHEYEQSLETLLPIKRDLARTDALIDKIVYKLYGLTDAEIELIERPQYEQALADAKAQVVVNEKITDDEEKIEKIAEAILPAAQRFFERVEPATIEEQLDRDLPGWRMLSPDAPTFLLTGDYNLRTLPDHMDFSSSVIPYAKAVEVVLQQRIFEPFRQQHRDAHCVNDHLRKFMQNEKELTLGSFMIILSSSRETALRQFIQRQIPDADKRIFGAGGLVTILNDDQMRAIRNKAAHDEVLRRDEAQQTRDWAMQILGKV